MSGRHDTRGVLLGLPACLLAIGILGLSLVWSPDTLPGVDLCWFHRLTGFPCPGCGLSHAISAISHGAFGLAWRYHPFGYVFYAILLFLAAGPAVRRAAPGVERLLHNPRVLVPAVWALLASMILFGIGRIAVLAPGS